ncbi:hypothetical protein Tco_1227522 [Tanacetum coccineum]
MDKRSPLTQERGNPTASANQDDNCATDQNVYVRTHHGFVDPDHPDKSLTRLRKALYGLKQAPESLAKDTLEILRKHGMEKRTKHWYTKAIEPKLDADLSGEPVDQTDYHSKIRSLMYLTSSRPDIVQAVCYCARYQARPTKKHLKEVKRIFRYLRGTIHMGLWYPKGSGFELTTFSDVDHAGCLDTRKSTSRGIEFLGHKLVSWMSKKQDCTPMSSVEAEYVALSASYAQVMWMRTQLKDYGFDYNKILLRPYALSWKPCQGDSLNLPDHRIHKDGDGDASFQLKSDSLPHAHAQTTKTFYKHQDSRIMKAQELKTKTSAQTLIYKIFLQRYQVYQGRLLASFQDDAKYEHVGQDTRSQGGKDDQDKQGKDLKISDKKQSQKTMTKAQDQKSQSMKEQCQQEFREPRPQDLNDK